MNKIEQLESVVEELKSEVNTWGRRLENIEFALGIAPHGSTPMDSQEITDLKQRLTTVELALGVNE